ncbi:MAG: hypothetical protein PHS82_16015 [Lachnospiraceae bacterium]|nr:hypothetical protein [Lachnospiraceae bacterium]
MFSCDIELQKTGKNGQYPVTLEALAYDGNGEKCTLSCTVYVQVQGLPEENEAEPEPEKPADDGSVPENDGSVPENDGSVPENDMGGDVNGGDTGGGGTDSGQTPTETLRKPKFTCISSSINGQSVSAGAETEIQSEFKNQSKSLAAYNLKVSIECEDANLSFSSLSAYVGNVSAGQTFSMGETMTAALNTEQGMKSLKFQFDYEDKSGTAYTDTEEIRFTVVQTAKAALGTVLMPDKVTEMANVPIEVSAVNEGHAPVYNVRISLAAEGIRTASEAFLGNLEAGTQGQGSLSLYISALAEGAEGGETAGTITLAYEDAYGQTYEETRECSTVIQKAESIGFQKEEEQKTNAWWITLLVIVFLILAAVIGGLVWQIRKLQRR